MKNLKVKLMSFLMLSFVMVSCGSDEPIAITPPLNEVLENLNNGIMEGKLSEDYTLDQLYNIVLEEHLSLKIMGY